MVDSCNACTYSKCIDSKKNTGHLKMLFAVHYC